MALKHKEDEDEKSVFEEVVEGDPGVCENCFKRTHQVEEDWHPSQEHLFEKGHDGEYYEMQAVEREKKFAPKRFHPVRENVDKCYYPEDAAASTKGRNVCKDCGIIDQGLKIRPISKDEAITYTKNLSKRLEENGVGFDKNVLFECVKELKSRPDHQTADDSIFEASVKVAIKYSD